MRAAVILGLGCSPKSLKPFQDDASIEWHLGMPAGADQVDIILLFGGDGTIHRHLGQLVKLGVPVLVVPAGSGNDFARALGLRRVRDSIAAWKRFCSKQDNVRPIDLGLITPLDITGGSHAQQETARPLALATQRYFCCVAGVGLDADVARRANQWPRWLRGHGGYVLSVIPTILRFAPLPMKIRARAEAVDAQKSTPTGTEWTTRSDRLTVLAIFANTPVYGGGMRVAPRALMDDGRLDVCLVSKIGRIKLLSLFPSVYFGRHLSMSEVDYFQASGARVETEPPIDVYADGEYVCQTPIEVGLQAKALRVVTP